MKILIIIFAVLLVVLILIQQKNSSLGSMMGSDSEEGIEKTRRGSEKMIHNLTVITSVLFIISTFYYMIATV